VSLEILTLGCRLNAAESEAMRSLAGNEDDLIIVNSCAVTNEAVRQARQAIRRAKRARPEARVIVTGCAAQVDPAAFAAMPEVSRVIGNREKFDPSSFSPSVGAEPVEALPFSSLAAEERTAPFDAASGVALDRLRQAQGERGLGFGALAAEIRVSDIMAIEETAPHLAASFSDRSRRLRRGAVRVRSPLHLLHNTLWPRETPFGAGVAGRHRRSRLWTRLSGGRADGRRRHQLRTRPSRRAEASDQLVERILRMCPIGRSPPPLGRSTVVEIDERLSTSSQASLASCRTSI
jgi:hypothetical protein